jgi:hypothetical protein
MPLLSLCKPASWIADRIPAAIKKGPVSRTIEGAIIAHNDYALLMGR